MTDLRKLDAAATQGVWEAKTFYKDNEEHHSMRLSPQRGVYGTFWPDDAALAAALVNAYRAGELVEAPKEGE